LRKKPLQELTQGKLIIVRIANPQDMQLPSEHQTPRCPNCLAQVVMGSTGCSACGREFGAPLLPGENANPDPDLLRGHRWTWVSLGSDPLGRQVGKAMASSCVFFALYACLVMAFSDPPKHPALLLSIAVSLFYIAYVIHGFTHGRPIYLLRMGTYEATPANTGVRTFGLATNLVAMAFFTCILLR
jgi:hypothetical protein